MSTNLAFVLLAGILALTYVVVRYLSALETRWRADAAMDNRVDCYMSDLRNPDAGVLKAANHLGGM
ncbi:MAG: hypothetical protein HOQ24_06215 [Mycobacteriaceae bacterium]|nr:hypothetical protein [Mycobacteriaceae bacterium]